MKNFKIEINFEDVVGDMFCTAETDEYGAAPTMSFNEVLQEQIVREISQSIIKQIKSESLDSASKLAKESASNFIDSELEGIIIRKLRSGEINTRYDSFKTFDELIEKRLNASRLEEIVKKHVERKADDFAKEMKTRYDNIFAAKVVGSLNKQKMLSPDVAKILLGDID